MCRRALNLIFKVVLVSQSFEEQMPVKRHQLIYKILSDEMQGAFMLWPFILIPPVSGTSVKAWHLLARTAKAAVNTELSQPATARAGH